MMTHPKKADFYTNSVTYNDYGEEVYSSTLSFTTGVRLSTMSFKETLKTKSAVDTTKLFCFARKNTNTLTVSTRDFVKVDGVAYQVVGVDPKHGDRAEIMFLLDIVEDTVL
jgi:hypothetical protein